MESRKSVNIIKHIFTRGNPFSFEFDTVTRTGSLANCFLRSINKKSRKVSIFYDICLSANPLPFFRLADNYAVFFSVKPAAYRMSFPLVRPGSIVEAQKCADKQTRNILTGEPSPG